MPMTLNRTIFKHCSLYVMLYKLLSLCVMYILHIVHVGNFKLFMLFLCWQTWPIFAKGGEYGPRYDVFDESQKRSSEVDPEPNLYFNPLLSMSKKDLESLLHQPNPALTVQQLPQNPKISFRKGHPSEKKGKYF